MSRAAATPLGLEAARERAARTALPWWAARLLPFVGLALFGMLHWVQMLDPEPRGRGLAAVLVAVAGALALAVAGGLGSRRLRLAAASGVAVAVLAGAFATAGIDGRALLPDRWGELAGLIGRGLAAIPGLRVPYRGADETAALVILLGGTALTGLAGLLSFWPRRGRPLAGLLALVTLYVVPTVAIGFERPVLRGALLALLVLAFLRLERLRRRELAAGVVVALFGVAGAAAATPVLDRDAPWFDYESWALGAANAKTTSFSWDHDYGPLDWPRDGREVLRVRAQQPAYWKAETLGLFDGQRWRDVPIEMRELPEARDERWEQDLRVTVRNLRSDEYVTAGAALAVDRAGRRVAIGGTGQVFDPARALRRGDAYTARVYTPRPDSKRLRASGELYESGLDGARFVRVRLRGGDTGIAPLPGQPSAAGIVFAPFGSGEPATAFVDGITAEPIDALEAIRGSDLRRSYDLAARLAAGSSTPYDFVKRVERHLSDGFSYTETPVAAAETLDGFLFDAREGYCQQFSGAMALLLRMGGVPARVAAGFSTGSLDDEANEFVVRDFDAHSWVEVWFPNVGWVQFDPTPAASPARSQAASAETDAPAALGGGLGDLAPGDRRSDPASNAAAVADEPSPWGRVVVILAVLTPPAWLAGRRARRWWLARPRPDDPDLAELERALRRAGAAAAPGETLRALEERFAHSPAALEYLRTVRAHRYGRAAARPSGRARRGLRAALRRGQGPLGSLRALWAVPPQRGR